MTTTNRNIADILYRQLQGSTLPAQDQQLLDNWLQAAEENRQAVADLGSDEALKEYLAIVTDRRRPSIAFEAFEKETMNGEGRIAPLPPVQRVHFLKTTWVRYAAVLLLIAGTATFLYRMNKPQKEVLSQAQDGGVKATDVLPGGNKAILTLSDGSTIVLDSAAIGNLAQQGSMKILKPDAGSLAYQGNDASGAAGYNTISTPKGGQYQVTLPDGTKAWLNVASSIRFPTAFAGNRKVTITGEVYFETATDKNKPFEVTANGVSIDVLGTSFNVNAYADEPVINTTLVEGSVQVARGTDKTVLKPGEAAIAAASGGVKKGAADIDKAIAWKKGIFNFEGLDMAAVMRQLARWYAIDIVYEKGVPDIDFVGKIRKDVSLGALLQSFEGFGIHYRMEDRRLIILP